MAVSSITEHWIKQGALTINLNHFGDPDYLQVSLLAGTVVMAYKSGVIDYNAAHDFRTWPLEAANTYLETTSAYNVYARLTRNEVNAKALIVYDPVLRDIEGRETTYEDEVEEEETEGTEGSEGTENSGTTDEGTTEEPEVPADPDYYFIYLGRISASVDEYGRNVPRYWEEDFRFGNLNTDQYYMEEGLGAWAKMFRLNETTDLIEVLKTISSAIINKLTIAKALIFSKERIEDDGSVTVVEKEITDVKRSIDSDQEFLLDEYGETIKDEEGNPVPNPEYVPISDETIPTTAYIKTLTDERYLKKYEPDETQHRIKFFDGVECGEYNEGPLAVLGGTGTLFDGAGYGEMNGLRLREFLEVPELRYNRIDVISGILWNSIAFGLVESVDTEKRICTLKLEDGERSGLHVNDICIGIFSDFGTGTVDDEENDENGFPKMYGFRTSYFTPTEILVNESGKFQFRYSLQHEESTPHPCESMKFAVYGNFIDETRRASAYSTRTYKRYLNNVASWDIRPNDHIYAQFGRLDGLTIGGFTMKGYGSFQSNSYFTGTQIQFTPDQLGELKGEDAYSVQLSDYEGVVVVDDEGNIIGGADEMMNVITDGMNVITDGQNVVVRGFKLQTAIQARRGSTPLTYSTIVEEGCYIVGLDTIGCEAMMVNGVVVVTKITNVNSCSIEITVNCEGMDVFNLDYKITAIRNGTSPITMDIDNEMDAIACDSEGKYLFGLPVTFNVYMWSGTEQLYIEHISLDIPQVSIESEDGTISTVNALECELETDTYLNENEEEISYYTGKVTVVSVLDESERVIPVKVTAYATYNGIQYYKEKVFTLNKVIAGENSVLYKLRPSVTALKVDDKGEMTNSSVRCFVVQTDGKTVSELEELPENVVVQYYIGDDSSAMKTYEYGTDITLEKDDEKVTFVLYVNNVLWDLEEIFVIKDGLSSDIDTIYSTLENPSKPVGHPNTNTEWEAYVEGKDYIWQATSTYRNGEWSEWVVTKVKGDDAVTYEVEPPSLTLRKTLTGTITPEATQFTCYRCQGEKREEVAVTWSVLARNNMDEQWGEYPVDGMSASFIFQPNQNLTFKHYMITALPQGYTSPLLVQVGQTEDMKGPMPRYCGLFDPTAGKKYYYNEEYRDIVVYSGQVFQVWPYNPDGYVTATPNKDLAEDDHDNYWQKANKFSFVAMDTALINGAHIAGFTFLDNVMVGGEVSSPTLKLDGVNGKIEAEWGKIGGFDLIGSELMGENTVVYPDNPEITGSQKVLLAPNGLNMYSSSISSSVQYYQVSIGEREDYGVHVSSLNRGGIYVSTDNTGLFGKYALYADGKTFFNGNVKIDGNLTVTGSTSSAEVDTELSPDSENPVANSTLYNKFVEVDEKFVELEEKIEEGGGGSNVEFHTSLPQLSDLKENVLYVIG